MELILKGSSEEIKSVLQAEDKKHTENIYISPIDGKKHITYMDVYGESHDITLN